VRSTPPFDLCFEKTFAPWAASRPRFFIFLIEKGEPFFTGVGKRVGGGSPGRSTDSEWSFF